ncbi:PIR Superfamily Protein [Plasmodium ovale wallikeri]|uniref:PIR Superfamily Protein n=1 Tax=Plasmodium ovale wallikeri TaxID=864142 RepID=A0A1A9AJD4_PLAOA|nr:PIR Superfamily Protein [Plasmodium ovale wallikeri]SBT56206.1 PIR Superfamily Protein [Plasmodium ovale wallikeri]
MTSSKWKKYYDIVGSFPINDNKFDITNVQSHENENPDSDCIYIKLQYLKDHNEFIMPCTNVAAYIKDLDNKCHELKESDRCVYMNYCINDVVRKQKNDMYNEIKLINAYKQLVTQVNKCTNTIEYIDNDDYEKLSDLYKMYYNFNEYVNKDNSYSKCDDLKKYVKPLYMKYQTICNENTNNDFCNTLEEFKHDYNINRTRLDECEHVDIMLPSFKDRTEHVSGESSSRGGIQGDELSSVGDSELGSSSSTILIVFSVILLIPVIFFILYKFTPFGPWIRPQILKQKKLWNHICDKTHQLFHNYGHRQLNSRKPQYNVQYDSMQNYQFKNNIE